MPNKTRRRARRRNGASVQQVTRKLQNVSLQPKRKKKATPFADAGAIAGQKLGSMFGFPMLKGVGRWLGSGIGTVLGSGDYNVVGPTPGYNVLFNSNQIPKFSTTRQTNIVSHREYLGDVFGTAGFNNISYPLNPGVATTFPWLSSVAQNYQEYKFHGILFEFRSLITDFVTNGAPGVVVMATNYNSDAPAYLSKQEMENSEYAVSVKPTCDLMHGVECATNQTVLSELYVRTGTVPAGQDLRLYDLGKFQFATQANPVQDLGELWVTYVCEFFKPVLPIDVGGNILSSFATRTGTLNAAPLGTTALVGPIGDLDLVFQSSTVFAFTAQPGNAYFFTITWNGTAVVYATPAITFSGLKLTQNTFANAGNPTNGPPAGTNTNIVVIEALVTCTSLNPGLVTVTLGGAGVIPATGQVTVSITQYSSEAVL